MARKPLNKADYFYCPSCDALVHKSHVTEAEEFWTAKKAVKCPKCGTVLEPAEEEHK